MCAFYNPPTENLPIFDVTVFRDIAPYDEFYLKRQGLATSVATETTFTGLVSFNSLTSPPHCSAVAVNPNDLANKAYVDALAPQTSYIVFLNYTQTFTTSTPTIYKKLNPLTNNTPTLVPFHTVNTTPLLIAGFFNTKADLKFANTIPAGLWNLILYANCAANNDQNHLGLNFVLIGVTSLGVETIIETSAYSPLINVLSPLVGTYSCILTVSTALDITAYDQIGIKVYALSNTSAGRDGSIFFQYPSYYSALQTSFATTQAADITITNNTWTGTNTFNNTTNLNTTIIQGSGSIQFPDTSVQTTAFKSLVSGIYTNSNITVDAQGAISAISTGVGGANAETIDLTLTATGTGYNIPYSTTTGLASTLLSGGLVYNRDTNTLAVNATNATNLIGGSAGLIPYQSGATTTAFIPVGTAGKVLQSNGAAIPTWTTDIGGNAGSATLVNLTVATTGSGNFIPISTTGTGNSALLTNASLVYEHSTNTITGNVTGTAGSATTSTNLSGGLIGNVLYQASAGLTTRMTNGAVGTVLTSGGIGSIPTWATDIGGNAGSSTTIALTGDNSAGNWFIPYSKTASATSNALYIDDTTTPLTYNANLGILSAKEYTIGGSGKVIGTNTSSIYQVTTQTIYASWALAGQHRFYTHTSGSVEVNPLNLTSTNISTNVPVNISTTSLSSASLTIRDTTTANQIRLFPSSLAGSLNAIVLVGDETIGAAGLVNTNVLTLTVNSDNTTGIRISPNAIILGSGGVGVVPATNISINGSAGTLVHTSTTCPTQTGYTLPAGTDATANIATAQWVQSAIPLATSASTTNLTGGVIGNVLYQASAGSTTRMVNGAVGTVLTSGGIGANPTWSPNLAGNAGSATYATNTTITNDLVSATSHALTFVSNTTGDLPQKTRANVGTGEGLTYIPSTNALNVNIGGVGSVTTNRLSLKDNLGNRGDLEMAGGDVFILNTAVSKRIYLQTTNSIGSLVTQMTTNETSSDFYNKVSTKAGIIGPTVGLTYTSDMIGYSIKKNGTAANFNATTTTISGLHTSGTNGVFLSAGVWMVTLYAIYQQSAAAGTVHTVRSGLSTDGVSLYTFVGGTGDLIVSGSAYSTASVSSRIVGTLTVALEVPTGGVTYYQLVVVTFSTYTVTCLASECYFKATRIA